MILFFVNHQLGTSLQKSKIWSKMYNFSLKYGLKVLTKKSNLTMKKYVKLIFKTNNYTFLV